MLAEMRISAEFCTQHRNDRDYKHIVSDETAPRTIGTRTIEIVLYIKGLCCHGQLVRYII
jgi:hypothetical protein